MDEYEDGEDVPVNIRETDAYKSMNPMLALAYADGVFEPESYTDYLAACQYILDTKMYLTLPGNIGRGIQTLLEYGWIQP